MSASQREPEVRFLYATYWGVWRMFVDAIFSNFKNHCNVKNIEVVKHLYENCIIS